MFLPLIKPFGYFEIKFGKICESLFAITFEIILNLKLASAIGLN